MSNNLLGRQVVAEARGSSWCFYLEDKAGADRDAPADVPEADLCPVCDVPIGSEDCRNCHDADCGVLYYRP